MSVPWQTPIPIVKDAFLTELVIRHVRNSFFFHPLLPLIESLWFDISWYYWLRLSLDCPNAVFLTMHLRVLCDLLHLWYSVAPDWTCSDIGSQIYIQTLCMLHVERQSRKDSSDIRFWFGQLFGPVNRPQNWKSWERRGEKLDYQAFSCLIVTDYAKTNFFQDSNISKMLLDLLPRKYDS